MRVLAQRPIVMRELLRSTHRKAEVAPFQCGRARIVRIYLRIFRQWNDCIKTFWGQAFLCGDIRFTYGSMNAVPL